MAMPSSFGALPRAYADEIELSDNIVLVQDDVQDDGLELVAQDNAEPVADLLVQDGPGLTDFNSPNGPLVIDAEAGTVTVTNNNDNHLAVYQGLDKKADDFVIEADVQLTDPNAVGSAAFLYGMTNKAGANWCGANFDTYRSGDDAFRVFGPGYDIPCGTKEGVDFSKPVHLKLDIKKDGSFVYTHGNVGAEQNEATGTIPNWAGGYVGLLTWQSEAVFSNISFENRTVEDASDTNPLDVNENYKTNLEGLSTLNGEWEVTAEGLHSNAVDKGDAFMYSATKCKDFVYSTDVKLLSDGGAASLLFRSNSATSHKYSYAVNLDAGSKACKFWRWTDGADSQLINEKKVPATEDNTYNLKVVAIKGWISYYVNNQLVASSGDYTLQPDDRGQDTCYFDGYFGLLNWNGDMVFQNTYYKAIEGDFDPTLTNVEVTSTTGAVEKKAQFSPNEPIFIQYVNNDASTVDINATAKSANAVVVVKDAEGNAYADGKNVPVAVGKNYVDVLSTVTAEDGTTATLTYRVNVHRRQQAGIYYNEPYRDQYHYSVKDGWGNDPNGLVYYKGKYHFFYQFYDDTKWGPMHWGHAISTDLVNWTEEPMALYPDANGAMFSGCIVADETNQSGLFSTDEGGLVALITCDGNGQRIKLAYSEDEGATWTKVDKIAADWSRDELGSMDFRDPKVFRWEGKWFMVIAGGPLRIYSSPNLVDWKCESTYFNLHTECPDMYPIKADDGAIKWVLSLGGRFYKVGDFKEVNGRWTFVPDEAYADVKVNGIMNFGKDSYAAMTFYVQDFGIAENPTLPEIIEINWMNTWDDYCNAVADKVGQKFNGTYNLALKEGLVKDGDKYVLTQTPIENYKDLRSAEPVVNEKDIEVAADNTVLNNFAGDCYEIVSTFRPAEGTTKVGFQLRVGEDEHTDVIYDIASKRLSIDRSKSGTQISGRFSDVDSQEVERNADGSVTLHIYVDRASVEVFTRGYTAAGGNQIFPSLDSKGAKVVVEGEPAKADIAIYALESIWNKTEATEPLAIQALTPTDNFIYAGDTAALKVALLPVNVAQDVEWTISEGGSEVVKLEAKGATAKVTGLKKGEATITAKSVAVPELSQTFTVSVLENNFQTNLGDFVNVTGNWIVDDITLSDVSRASNDFYMAKDPIQAQEYTMSTKVKFSRGLPNIFFAAKSTNPFDGQAYAVQLNDGTKVRLFRFAGDTLFEGEMGKSINDDQYHDLVITKKKDSVQVSVDGEQCIDYKFDGVEDYYNGTPYVGVGLWDGVMEVQTLNVTTANTLTASAKAASQTTTYNAKSAKTLASNITVKGAKGKVTYANASTNATAKKFKVTASNGKVSVPKATPAGSYKVIVSVKAAGEGIYKAATKKVTYTIKVAKASVKSATIAKVTDKAYTGKKIAPAPKVTLGGVTLKKGTDYTLTYAKNVKVGTATITVTGKGNYTGTKTLKFKIVQAANKATVKSTSVKKTFKATSLKKKAASVALPKVTAKFGTAKWKVATKDAKKVLSLSGSKVVVKKGAKKGTYTIKLKASVAKTANYKAATTKTVTVKVTVA